MVTPNELLELANEVLSANVYQGEDSDGSLVWCGDIEDLLNSATKLAKLVKSAHGTKGE